MSKFIDWLLDRDNCRSHPPLKTSITGEVLVRSTGGRGLYTTAIGMQGINLSRNMMLGNNFNPCLGILRGDYDHCITPKEKGYYISDIKNICDSGGIYRDVKHVDGHLEFIKCKWSQSELKEVICALSKIKL